MSVQTPHATFAQQRPNTAAPFLYKSQGLPVHVPVVTKSGTISVRPDQVMNLDCVETDMIVNPQTSPPAGFLNANGTRFQFQLLPSNYRIVHSYVEFDISNTTTAAVQLTPSPFLVDRICIQNGAGNILQEATGDQIYHCVLIIHKIQARPHSVLTQQLLRAQPSHIQFLYCVCFWIRLSSLLAHSDRPV